MKMNKCMESELSGIFRANLVAKNIVLGYQGTQHQALSAVYCLFLKKHKILWTRLLEFSFFLVK